MGMHGSATCTMAFEGANGWLAGHANDGIRNMFVMINLERIGVGVQGLGLCELATQAAIGYARARRQRSEEHTSELQSLMRISYAVFCLKQKKTHTTQNR